MSLRILISDIIYVYLYIYKPRKRTTIVTEQIQFSTKPKKGRPKGSGEPKLIQCRLCLKTFTIRSSLIFHVQTVHEGRKDFKCNICDKSFGRPVELKKHKKRRHDKNKNFICDKCGKGFPVKDSLKVHVEKTNCLLRLATQKMKKDNKCDLCEKKFTVKKSLDEHIKSFHYKIKGAGHLLLHFHFLHFQKLHFQIFTLLRKY